MQNCQKITIAQTVISRLENFDDKSNCGYRHELEGGAICPELIIQRRIGCPHTRFGDVLSYAARALIRIEFIQKEREQRLLRMLAFLFEELGLQDDVAAGQDFRYSYDSLGTRQKRVILQRARCRNALLQVARRGLEKIIQQN